VNTAAASGLPRRKVPPFAWDTLSPAPDFTGLGDHRTTGRRSMPLWNNYLCPQTLSQAISALAADPAGSRLVAGGTDLLLDLQQKRLPAVNTLIDVTHIPELGVIEIRQDRLFIGAAVPLNHLVASRLVLEHTQALHEACSLVGGPQVRNQATLGGNVAHALPAADGTIALLALAAQAEIADMQGTHCLDLIDLFVGPGRSVLAEQPQLITGFYLPLASSQTASAFRRIMRPQGVALPILNMAVWLHRQDNAISEIRLTVGPGGPVPTRLPQTEVILHGQAPTQALLLQATDSLLSEAHFRTSPHRASFAYRQHLAGVLLEQTLLAAWERTYPPAAQANSE
jgi:xanthine dehydrogenase FAD-binding subunit